MNLRKDHYHTRDPRSSFLLANIAVTLLCCQMLWKLFNTSQSFVRITRMDPKLCWKEPYYNFQQWMSRLPQQWRTQRKAIHDTNCKTSRIIELLNANCAPNSGGHVYLSVSVLNSAYAGFWEDEWNLSLNDTWDVFSSQQFGYIGRGYWGKEHNHGVVSQKTDLRLGKETRWI